MLMQIGTHIRPFGMMEGGCLAINCQYLLSRMLLYQLKQQSRHSPWCLTQAVGDRLPVAILAQNGFI